MTTPMTPRQQRANEQAQRGLLQLRQAALIYLHDKSWDHVAALQIAFGEMWGQVGRALYGDGPEVVECMRAVVMAIEREQDPKAAAWYTALGQFLEGHATLDDVAHALGTTNE